MLVLSLAAVSLSYLSLLNLASDLLLVTDLWIIKGLHILGGWKALLQAG
jgi:hypothetical protein